MLGHYRNGLRQRIEDEYEEDEYDHDYEDEGLEGEKEDKEKQEEERKSGKEELEFLKLREKRKEMYRQKLKKQSAKVFGHSIQTQNGQSTPTNTKFGSFFGPSEPVIASRVLDESRSIRETQHIISKPPSSFGNQRVSSFASSSERKLSEHHQPLKINEVKRKAQTLKDMRDYSFLLSDDVDLPDNKESQPASCHISAPKPDARSAQAALKSKIPISGSLMKSTSNGHGMKNAVHAARPIQTKLPMKGTHLSRPLPSSSEPKKIPGGKVSGIGQSRSVVPKPLAVTSKVFVQSKVPSSTSQPPKPISSRNIHDESLKKKPVKGRSDEDNDVDAIQMIRNMFQYNPSKYADADDDDRGMEADFSQIEKEERRSSQIARKEDEEQLRLIEEDERRERMRKKHKSNMR
ncbi:hypothetical protein IEQ34_010622 [Dendrobium chrysotoxum]|uniref:SPT2 chromatin protein n=1 Tax=Dendrobium chrysotoxum TaxID=161865 RepID=A0AAV7GDV0_DENCH|nr:hypothetical protein IEQ34_010622 [Dendrobium chrysotoxum]